MTGQVGIKPVYHNFSHKICWVSQGHSLRKLSIHLWITWHLWNRLKLNSSLKLSVYITSTLSNEDSRPVSLSYHNLVTPHREGFWLRISPKFLVCDLYRGCLCNCASLIDFSFMDKYRSIFIFEIYNSNVDTRSLQEPNVNQKC